MLFNSPVFVLAFLPVVYFGFYFLNKLKRPLPEKLWLIAASIIFYTYWDYSYLPLIFGSIIVDFAIGSALYRGEIQHWDSKRRLAVLIFGIVFNVSFLGYFKYVDFFLENVNWLTGAGIPTLNLVLPLAISFFTLQQIAYLVDCYRNDVSEHNFINYCLFVTFFPQLIAGPIVHHREMMPQFENMELKPGKMSDISLGVFIFSIGLFKKVVIADTLAYWASSGFDSGQTLPFVASWVTSLSYTLQLYFDFSAYSDMAAGVALLFGIRLPINFNSPYKAVDIRDFWRRWHITLSRWLKDYIYIPLGGNRASTAKTYFNLFFTFLIGGVWHGAAWTFIIWGLLHGAASVVHRLWVNMGLRLTTLAAMVVTFLFVNTTWVFFRATSVSDAIMILKGMVGLNGFERLSEIPMLDIWYLIALAMLMGVVFLAPSSMQMGKFVYYSGRFSFTPSIRVAVYTGALLSIAIVGMFISTGSEFLYFNF